MAITEHDESRIRGEVERRLALALAVVRLDTGDLSRRLKVSRRWIFGAVRQGTFPEGRLLPGQKSRTWTLSEIEQWEAAQADRRGDRNLTGGEAP